MSNSNGVSRYLETHDFVDITSQHSEIAKWCLDYLISPALSTTNLEEETMHHAKAGYFGFHEYASIYWY